MENTPHLTHTALLISLIGKSDEAPETPSEMQSVAGAADAPFGSFFYNGVAYAYSSLPLSLKRPETDWLFYGKSISDISHADTHAARMFTYGRATRGKAHRDVWKHQKGTSRNAYGVSGFFQTSKILEVVTEKYLFDQRKSPAFGLLYVIDSRGAELLDVDAFSAWIGRMEPENGEGEVLFSEALSPLRIVGAGVGRRDGEDFRLVKSFLNPNYTEYGEVQE